MAILETYEKQPAERKDYDIDYIDWLPDGDSIASAVATVVCTTGGDNDDLVVEQIDITSSSVKLWVSGGLDGQTYKVTSRITTNNASLPRIDESELVFRVKDA